MTLHAASMRSKRLQRVRDLLSDGGAYSTRQIVRSCDVCAVNSIISELRANGYKIMHWVGANGYHYYQQEGLDKAKKRY